MAESQTNYAGITWDVKIHDQADSARPPVHFVHPKYPFVSGVSINLKGERAEGGTITITFDAPYEQGIELLNDTTFVNRNVCEVTIGYVDGGEPERFIGVFNRGGEGLQLDANGLTGSITASFYSRVFGIEKMIKGTNLYEALLDALPPISSGKEKRIRFVDDDAESQLRDFKFPGFVGAKSFPEVIDFIHTALKGIELTWNALEGLVVTASPNSKHPERTFQMRGTFDSKNNIYPLLSYAPELGPTTFAIASPAAAHVTSAQVDHRGEVVVVRFKPEEGDEPTQAASDKDTETTNKDESVEVGFLDDTGSAFRPMTDAVLESKEFGAFWTGFLGEVRAHSLAQQSTDNQARILGERMKLGDARHATIETMGIPHIRPYEICNLRGVGELFKGPYSIREVTHRLALGTFMTTLVLYQDRSGSTGGRAPQKGPTPEAAAG